MSELAKTAREAMRKKAERMGTTDPHQRVDASSWTPPEPLNTTAKTGMRPVSRQARKSGGMVTGEQVKRADRTPRKGGGRALTPNGLINRDEKEANEERDGVKHHGGLKTGGRAGKADGGVPTSRFAFAPAESRMSKAAGLKTGGRAKRNLGGVLSAVSPAAALAQGDANALSPITLIRERDKHKAGGSVSNGEIQGTRPTGGREARKSGGRTGKTDINIIIAPNSGGPDGMAPPMNGLGPVHPPAAPPPMPPMPPGGPPMPPPGAGAPGPMAGDLPPGMPPMPRKSGGRTMDAGAGSGLGRLEKVKAYGKNARG